MPDLSLPLAKFLLTCSNRSLNSITGENLLFFFFLRDEREQLEKLYADRLENKDLL